MVHQTSAADDRDAMSPDEVRALLQRQIVVDFDADGVTSKLLADCTADDLRKAANLQRFVTDVAASILPPDHPRTRREVPVGVTAEGMVWKPAAECRGSEHLAAACVFEWAARSVLTGSIS